MVQGVRPTPYWPCEGRAHGQFSGALEERSGKGRKASADLSFIAVHIAAIEVGRAARVDEEPAAIILQRKASARA